ncbi:MAG: type IV pilus assembly protein PilM [Candidatus Moranbacteria bacterium]|nr:type IV pilus assembly protein PilM [Candidatus Moranbacteria bacterium]
MIWIYNISKIIKTPVKYANGVPACLPVGKLCRNLTGQVKMSFLQKKIFDFTPEVFGMEVNDFSIKAMQLEKEGKLDRVRSFIAGNIPPGAIEDGKIINAELVISIIKEIIKKAQPRRISTNKVVYSLPESKVFLRRIAIPKLGDKEISEAIKWELEANIPLPIDQVYFDWKVLDISADGKQNILTAAVAKPTVDEFVSVIEKAGLEVYGLKVESLSSARSLIDEKLKAEDAILLIVDLGLKKTIFTIVVGKNPCFTSSIPFSIEGIGEALAKKMNMSLPEIENALAVNGIADSGSPLAAAVQPLLENFAQEMEKTLDFFLNVSKDNLPFSRIILTGAGSGINGLPDFLAQRMGKTVVISNPLVNLKLNKEDGQFLMNQGNLASQATIIGLALWGLHYFNE